MSIDEFDSNPFGGIDYDEDGKVDLAEQDLDDDDIRYLSDTDESDVTDDEDDDDDD